MVALLFLVLVSASLALPGAWSPQNPMRKEYQTMVWNYVTPVVNKIHNTEAAALVPLQIVDVKTQSVSGQNIEMDVQMVPSKCLKVVKSFKAKTCPPSGNGPTQTFRVNIFSQPWTNTLEIQRVVRLQ